MDGTVAIVSRNYICINRRSVSIIFCLARIIKKYAKICTISEEGLITNSPESQRTQEMLFVMIYPSSVNRIDASAKEIPGLAFAHIHIQSISSQPFIYVQISRSIQYCYSRCVHSAEHSTVV